MANAGTDFNEVDRKAGEFIAEFREQASPEIEAMVTISSASLPPTPSFSSRRIPSYQVKSLICCCSSSEKPKHQSVLLEKESCPSSQPSLSRRILASVLVSPFLFPALSSSAKTKAKNPYDERRLLEQNKRIQRENNAPEEFPNFIREGFEVKVVTPDNYVKCDSGLIYRDFEVGKGDCPKDGQQVVFHYIGYNESGRRIDSTYLQGSPARIRLGNNALVPGFEMGIREMRPGGRRRIIIPPELGPPVGPSTFFSSKQFEVFDVELLSIQNCQRRTIGFYSDVICT
ncbi:PREDICTED: peptidyl-prolyl cis-trans isomerase FKBP20-2, chloroplastic [Tarenaya hassleriana]|uniref:peptidyl-prolyl cis-trans isomerase FKBP20-2, chloroplastic n=1 Tax=Tarenaya hassleriana TaxID=28532 RepID=UPI00053C0BBF|nr:PREDICTED: peptidyl-prolyl cis-trans isomerase FKBP20-2, chloroplastic [Tarenaya hassleriana]